MKKIIALCSIVIALGFVTIGCGGDKPDATAPAAVDTPSADVHDHDDHEGHDHE